MNTGLIVKLTKLREADDPAVRAGPWSTYVPGACDNTASLPVDYEIVGILMEPPVVGGNVEILRLDRNGVRALGVSSSTRVVSVSAQGFATMNSLYLLEPYEDSDPGIFWGRRAT